MTKCKFYKFKDDCPAHDNGICYYWAFYKGKGKRAFKIEELKECPKK